MGQISYLRTTPAMDKEASAVSEAEVKQAGRLSLPEALSPGIPLLTLGRNY